MNDTSPPPKDQSEVRQARLRDALRANLKKRKAQLRGRNTAGGEGDSQQADAASTETMMTTTGDQR